MLRHLLTSVSYGAMTVLMMHHAEEDQRKSESFMSYVKARQHHELKMIFRGKPFLPVFHAGHWIKPANWNDAPVVQS